jgi:hypothetical protein
MKLMKVPLLYVSPLSGGCVVKVALYDASRVPSVQGLGNANALP